MTITKTTRLLAAHDTRIRIKLDDPASLTWGMKELTLAEGRGRAVVNWGDGTRTEVTASGAQEHTYAQPGEYEVRISDDLSALQCLTRVGQSAYQLAYAPMIREFRTNATLLEKFGTDGFYKAVNLSAFQCKGSGVREIGLLAFRFCTGLLGRLDFPQVSSIGKESFSGATGITELHFSEANEAVISALPGFTTAFGAENADVFFDL